MILQNQLEFRDVLLGSHYLTVVNIFQLLPFVRLVFFLPLLLFIILLLASENLFYRYHSPKPSSERERNGIIYRRGIYMHQFNQNRLNYRVFKFCVVLVYFFFVSLGVIARFAKKLAGVSTEKKRLVSHRMNWAKHHHCAPNRRQCFVKTTFYKQFGSIFLCSAISINR